MTEPSKLAVEVAAVLDEFVASQRRQALSDARLQKLVFQRQVGEGAIISEFVIDEQADAAEIYARLARVETAADRLKAKVDLSLHFGTILNKCGVIDMARKKYAADRVEFEAKNAAQDATRRVKRVGLTDQQQATLKNQLDTIKGEWEKIEETQKAIAECQRILAGEDPFQVLADQIDRRLDELRGSRPAAA